MGDQGRAGANEVGLVYQASRRLASWGKERRDHVSGELVLRMIVEVALAFSF